MTLNLSMGQFIDAFKGNFGHLSLLIFHPEMALFHNLPTSLKLRPEKLRQPAESVVRSTARTPQSSILGAPAKNGIFDLHLTFSRCPGIDQNPTSLLMIQNLDGGFEGFLSP